jgi:ATP-dependent helicase/nuclease subunit A
VTPRQQAALDQARAADPAVSAWVGASAGSGKTKVLTDRVLRLLLTPGTRPESILCLTFTKAAAAEMADRLARALGRFAVMPEPALAGALGALLARDVTGDDILRARGLFARVLDLPGGMRISTIHAFCQSLLRAFPIEAGLTPHFAVIEDGEAATLLAEAREAVLAAPGTHAQALTSLAGLVPPQAFADLLVALARDRVKLEAALAGGLDPLLHRLATHLGLDPGTEEGALLADAATAPTEGLVAAARLQEASRNANDRARGVAILDWLARDIAGRAAGWDDWVALFLTGEGTVRDRLGTKDIGPRQGESVAVLRAEALRILAVEGQRRSARLFAATRALLAIAAPILARAKARKRAAGLMDYDDLIQAADQLLRDPGSAWVRFKLDGGIDHVLLDEAQDSNRAQWEIAAKLTEEFFVGEGAAPRPRSLFAVGDTKQSIYRFQGADPGGFARWRARFAARAAAGAAAFRDVRLQVSFRSAPPVLALVDAVFAEGPARAGVVEGTEPLLHRPDREGAAGRVELWPMLTGTAIEPPPAWDVPLAPIGVLGAPARLAEALAERIAGWLANREMLPARDRPIRAGDILVLLRSRTGPFLSRLVRALKRRGVPVGGADRMRLTEQLAVQDLMALGDVLLLPEDDLQLAAVLTSPLVGLSQAALAALAVPRPGSLWAALAARRGEESPEGAAADWLAGLMAETDLMAPHELFARVLGRDGRRARLLARLGPDAADPIDEFLAAALAHARRHPPSLQGFLHHLRQGAAEVKREPEAAGDAVRIMTVHGAKGLQAPIVILVDLSRMQRRDGGVRWAERPEGALPLWAPGEDFRAPAYQALLEAEAAAGAEEENRLLYVALTRAEDRLLIAGAQAQAPKEGGWKQGGWYDLVAAGFRRLGAPAEPFTMPGFGPAASALALESPQREAPRPEAVKAASAARPLPAWARHPAAQELGEAALAASAIPGEGPAAPPRGAADPTGARFRRGRLLHALLQHLPEHPLSLRAARAAAFLARQGLDEAEQADIAAEALAVMDHPAIKAAFAPGSLAEAPLAGRVAGRLIAGQVDRLLVAPDRILVLDYKTNRPPPETLAAAPAPYLRQMAAYRALLRQAFPGRSVDCALVWTYGARVMALPDALLDLHSAGGSTAA